MVTVGNPFYFKMLRRVFLGSPIEGSGRHLEGRMAAQARLAGPDIEALCPRAATARRRQAVATRLKPRPLFLQS